MLSAVVTWALFAVVLLVPRVEAECSLSCMKEKTPVCAHSWILGYRNFSDKCAVEQANNCGGGDYSLIHVGPCLPSEMVGCPLVYLEVCGFSPTLGFRNFVSLCFLNLIALYTDFKIAHNGACTPVELPPPTCPGACPLLYLPVCGYNPVSGYRTFPNSCALGQENQCNFGNYIAKHTGVCTEAEISSNCPRACTKEFNPVCGKSEEKGYKTFGNLCTFYSLTHCSKTDSDYKLVHSGQCTTDEIASFCQPGFCQEVGEPVCASSLPYYRTFPNKCQFYVENSCKYGDFLLEHDGECTTIEKNNSCAATCSKDALPVCGYSDARGYKTFINRCLVSYDNACLGTDYGTVHLGECKKEELGLICKKSFCQKYKGLKVCGVSPTKGYATFDNQCFLYANNICKLGDYELAHFGECSVKEQGLFCLPEFCSLPGKAVCGYSETDGYFTFLNLCLFNKQNICFDVAYVLKHKGKCTDSEIGGKCPFVCTADYTPVCGFSNNFGFKTFSNTCWLNGENSCNGGDYALRHTGECTESETEKNCQRVCPYDFQPVCGQSPLKGLVTFPNECLLNYDVACFGSDFKLLYGGECEQVPPPEDCTEPTICTLEYSPVCAYRKSDRAFKTFSNKCFFDADNKCKYNLELIFAHDGECSSEEQVNDCKRICPPDEAPVCGFSPTLGYKSFKNTCTLLLGLSCFRSDFGLAYEGRCQPPDVPPTCTSLCLASYTEPLCSFSPSSLTFKTFPNVCFFNQANGCAFTDYIVAHAGTCTTPEKTNDCLRACPAIYSPVCGYSPTRGYKTFGNVCTFIRDLTCKGCDYVYVQNGKCKYPEGPQEGCPVLSSPDENPVCAFSTGTNSFRTFLNPDLLKAENQCFYGDYVFVHKGKCTRDEIDKKCYRKCKLEYIPVCGKNEKEGYRTFPSLCELEVANKCDGAAYSLNHSGKCLPEELEGKCHHVCPLYYVGICGYSKKKNSYETFPNLCFLDRENTCSLSDYIVAHEGKCLPPETGNKCLKKCKRIFSPVCAINSKKQYKNFPNFCLLDRDNSCFSQDYNVVHPGECFPWELCINCKKL